MGVQFELRKMVDQALGCPDKGIVDFNMLHSLLHEILNHLDHEKAENDIKRSDVNKDLVKKASDEDYTDRQETASHRSTEKVNDESLSSVALKSSGFEDRLNSLESRLKVFDSLPTDRSLITNAQQTNEGKTDSENTLAMMWKFITINRRVQATEEAVEKIMGILNEMLQDISQLKRAGSEPEKNHEDHLTVGGEFDAVKSGVLQTELEKVSDFMKQFESLDGLALKKDLAQFVTWSALEQALNKKGVQASQVDNAVGKRESAEQTCPERPGTAPVTSDTNSAELDHVTPPKTAMSPKEFVKLTGKSPGHVHGDGVTSSKESSFVSMWLDDGSVKKEASNVSRETTQDSIEPSPELITKLNRLGELPKQYDDVAVQVSTLSELQSKLASDVHKVEVDILPKKVDREDLQLPDNLVEQIEMLKQGLDFLSSNQDMEMLSSVKATCLENKENIDSMKRELALFSQHLKRIEQPRAKTPEDSGMPGYDQDVLNSVRENVTLVQREQEILAQKSKEEVAKILENLDQKQRFIDDLFQYAERLQERKADRENVATEMDVKADKHALESKVNQSTFDETFQMFDRGLQETLQKMEDYMNEEMSLKDTLSRISHEMEGKIDGDSMQLMKDYFEKQIRDVQESRDKIARETRVDASDAAGIRRKLPIHYHCISCNRPVEVAMRDSEPALPGNESLPVRPLKFPYTSYEVEQLRQRSLKASYSSEDNAAALSEYMSRRPCGGSHTVINSQLRRSTKLHQFSQTTPTVRDDSRPLPKMSREVSVLDFLRGSDGHYYKGRTRQLLPSIPKRTIPASSDAQLLDQTTEQNTAGFHQRIPSPPARDRYVDNLSSSYPEKSFNDTKIDKVSLMQHYSADDINVATTSSTNNNEAIKILQTRRKKTQDKDPRRQRCWDNRMDMTNGKIETQKSDGIDSQCTSPKSMKRTTPLGQEESRSASPETTHAGLAGTKGDSR